MTYETYRAKVQKEIVKAAGGRLRFPLDEDVLKRGFEEKFRPDAVADHLIDLALLDAEKEAAIK